MVEDGMEACINNEDDSARNSFNNNNNGVYLTDQKHAHADWLIGKQKENNKKDCCIRFGKQT